MSTAAAKKFAETALQLFPPFQWDTEQEVNWIDHVMAETSHFSPVVLERATKDMLRTRKRKDGLPSVGEMIAYCTGAKRWLDAEDDKGKLPVEQKDGTAVLAWSAERRRLADQIACNPRDPVCMQAAKEGWAGILHDFVRNHGRMPNVRERVEYRKTKHAPVEILNEIEWCRREAKDFMEAYEREIARSSGSGMVGDVARSLVRGYGDEIMRRRNDKADRILHGVLP